MISKACRVSTIHGFRVTYPQYSVITLLKDEPEQYTHIIGSYYSAINPSNDAYRYLRACCYATRDEENSCKTLATKYLLGVVRFINFFLEAPIS